MPWLKCNIVYLKSHFTDAFAAIVLILLVYGLNFHRVTHLVRTGSESSRKSAHIICQRFHWVAIKHASNSHGPSTHIIIKGLG